MLKRPSCFRKSKNRLWHSGQGRTLPMRNSSCHDGLISQRKHWPRVDVLNAQFAVDGNPGKDPDFYRNVATIYAHAMAFGVSGNEHDGGKAEVYMGVDEAIVKLLKCKK